MTKKLPPSISYQKDLLEDLKDPEEAISYLNASLDENKMGDEESQKLLLQARRNVAEAQGGEGYTCCAHFKKICLRDANTQGREWT